MDTLQDPSRVTEAQVAERLAGMRRERPRLIVTPGDVAAFRRAAATQTATRALADEIVRRARGLLDVAPLEHRLEGRRLLSVSREALNRQILLGVAWWRTGDRVFVQRAEKELMAVCAFSDWNPSHFLDTAEMSLAVAIAYDWLHDELSPEARRAARAALVTQGLQASVDGRDEGWIRARNNWGQVCHAGMAAAALAIAEDEPDLARRTIHRAVVNVPAAMAAYAPAGVYPEGPGYWDYGTSFNVILIDCLVGALGTDFGLAAQPGFLASADYMIHATGPTGLHFNYSDCGLYARRNVTLLWFAARHGWHLPAGSPELAMAQGDITLLPRHDRLLGLMPFRLPSSLVPHAPLPLDWQGDGIVPIAVHRGGWDGQAWYVGIKAGSPSASHGHMDGGSFVLEACGERWGHDLGAENYHRIEARGVGLWDGGQTGERWRVFRNGITSHGTLTIDEGRQLVAGRATITTFTPDPKCPLTRLDLTPLYSNKAGRVERTFTMPDRAGLTVADRLEGLQAGARVRWSLLTKADVTVGAGGAKLRQNGKGLALRVTGLPSVQLEVVPVETLLADFDSPAPGFRLVRFEAVAPADGRLAWQVAFTKE